MINEFDALSNYEQILANIYANQEALFYTSSFLPGFNWGLGLLGLNATSKKIHPLRIIVLMTKQKFGSPMPMIII